MEESMSHEKYLVPGVLYPFSLLKAFHEKAG